MATAQTYRRQFKKTFKIVDDVASEYYDLLDKEKIEEDDNFICTYSDLEKIEGLYYKGTSSIPFTGKVNGIIQGNFVIGKKEGQHIKY